MGKKKTKTSETRIDHAVVTPNNPDWVNNGAQGLAGRIQGLGGVDPTSYVAPASDLQRQAALGASRLRGPGEGSGQGVGSDAWFRDLMSSPTPQVGAASLLDNLDAYQNPYRHQVVDAATADFDADAGRTRAAQDLSLAGQGAFGGSGAALARSQTEGELARARNVRVSQLMSDMFNTGAGLSSQDATRRQEASTANANLAQQHEQMRQNMGQFQAQYGLGQDANSRANIEAQQGIGAKMRGIDQETRLAPVSALGRQIEMFSGLPLSMFHGQTSDSKGTANSTSSTSDPWGSAQQALQVAAQVAAGG